MKRQRDLRSQLVAKLDEMIPSQQIGRVNRITKSRGGVVALGVSGFQAGACSTQMFQTAEMKGCLWGNPSIDYYSYASS